MKILVTGSSGFIGFHLIKKLIHCGYEVIGIDNNNNYYNPALKLERLAKLKSKQFTFYQNDINKIEIKEKKIDVAINLAAQAGVRVKKNREHLYDQTNVKGFESLCNFCEENNIKKIIYASSSSVYSDKSSEKLSETAEDLIPKSKYGRSKLANEIYANNLVRNSKLSFVGLRFFTVYGPYGRPDMAYYLFTKKIKKGEIINLNNDGNMYRDMTYIDDVIDGILAALDYLSVPRNYFKNEIFNLGNDKPIKTFDLLSKIENQLGIRGKVNFTYTKNEAKKTHADISKAKNLLGYQPKVCLDEGLKKFLDWHKKYEHL